MHSPLDLLKAFRPTALTPEEQAAQDAQATAAQAQDPSWKRMARSAFEGGSDALMGLVGVGPDTQANKVGQLGGAAGAVFGIPPAIARRFAAGLPSMLRQIEHLDPRIVEGLQFAAEKYPRVTGHIQSVSRLRPGLEPQPREGVLGPVLDRIRPRDGTLGAQLQAWDGLAPTGLSDKVSELQFASPEALRLYRNQKGFNPIETVGHELTHAAQQIGLGKRFRPNYKEATKQLGYWDNPYEESARAGGAKFQKAFEAWKKLRTPPYPPILDLK